jgi:NAD(P)-dependent dehydrogenase (short-subunit alcohol dehydrogenase family)
MNMTQATSPSKGSAPQGSAFEGRELAGKVAVVTGAAIGIGRAIAAELGAAGARVVIADLRDAPEAAKSLADDGVEAIGVTADVTSPEALAELARATEGAFGGADILVNNAGLFAGLEFRPFTEIPLAEWHKVMDVNVLGCFLAARALVPQMRARGGGRIVNIGSTSQFKGTVGLVHYSASKGAVTGLTRALARELGPDNILVNQVAPGFTLSSGVTERLDGFSAMHANAPGARVLRRDMAPSDVVGAVRFLAGPGAPFMTGQTLVVDGGAVFH